MAGITKNLRVDAAKLRQRVEILGSIGWQHEGGIVRPVYSPDWLKAREQYANLQEDCKASDIAEVRACNLNGFHTSPA